MNVIRSAGAWHLQVLAVGTGEDGANNFLSSSLGTALVGLCGAFGVVVAVICVVRMVKSVTSGRPGEGIKVIMFGLVVSGMLFNLNLTITGAKDMGNLVQKAFDSITSVTG